MNQRHFQLLSTNNCLSMYCPGSVFYKVLRYSNYLITLSARLRKGFDDVVGFKYELHADESVIELSIGSFDAVEQI